LPGHCFIIESVIFKELGLLDEKMVMLWSDIDFHKRLAVKKKKVGACFTAQIHHFGHKTTDIVDIDEQAKKDTQYFFKKWPTLKKIGAKYSYSKRILEVK
jgi:GT2 family glycosyltransferase